MTQNNTMPMLPEDEKGIESLGTEVEKMPKRFEVENIEAIEGELLDQLLCGDVVAKKTMDGDKELFHTYIVSHKQETGICLTYSACGYLETISYDKIEGEWTFNSKDVWQAE